MLRRSLAFSMRSRVTPPSIAFICTVAMAVAMAGAARADDDYDPRSREWNGLARLVDLARDEGAVIETPSELDLGALSPEDGVLLVYPHADLPVASLAGFMRDGGRLALADDFGTGDELLDVYRIHREAASTGDATHLRGNPNLPVAQPHARHVLTDGLTAIVANHPSTLYHAELEPLLAFDSGGRALVLAGAVGEGRLVAVGDPSVLINNMLELRDNERFARNLVRYVVEGGGRFYVVTGDTALVGRYGEPGSARPFHDVRSWLESLASADAPPLALLLLAIVIASILLVVAVSALPRRSPYDGSSMFGPPPASGGFVGRVGYFGRKSANLLHPLMVYKFELEGEIVRRMRLEGRTLLRDVLDGLRTHGVPEPDVLSARALLLELDRLRDRQDRPPGPPKVTPARFRELVARGERLLSALAEPRASVPPGNHPRSPRP